jgi:hypothetical protein
MIKAAASLIVTFMRSPLNKATGKVNPRCGARASSRSSVISCGQFDVKTPSYLTDIVFTVVASDAPWVTGATVVATSDENFRISASDELAM